MKIAWFSPLHQQSAIGRYSVSVTAELATRGHHVSLFRTEMREWRKFPALDSRLLIRPSHEVDADWIKSSFDLAIYNVGDHFLNHGGIMQFIQSAPGICIFHDFFIYNFFRGWCAHEGISPSDQMQYIGWLYDHEAMAAAEQFERGRLGYDSAAAFHPMTEWIANQSIGAFTHAHFYSDRIRRSCPGPVATHHLTYPIPRNPARPMPKDNEVRLLTVGTVNSNKCVDLLIDAMSHSSLLRTVGRYHIAGEILDDYKRALEAKANAAGLQDRVSLLGSVDDAQLAREMDEADIVCCLRRPVLEGASASAIEGLLSGRPVLVIDDGFYAELPDDMVIKVSKDAGADEVAWRLDQLVHDKTKRLELGQRAQLWATDHFSVGRYCDSFLHFADEVEAVLPLVSLSDQVAHAIAAMGVGIGDPLVDRMTSAMQALLAPRRNRVS